MSLEKEQQKWLEKLNALIKECPVEVDQGATELSIAKLKLAFANQYIEDRLMKTEKSLTAENSKAFIHRHGITRDMVHDFSHDKKVNAMHDMEKIHRYLRENASKPWICFGDYLFQTSVIKSGVSIFEHGFLAKCEYLGK